MEGSEIGKYFEEHGDEINEMLKRKEQENNQRIEEEKSNMVIGSYFHEHGEEVRKMLIRKSFSDKVKAEEKAKEELKGMEGK